MDDGYGPDFILGILCFVVFLLLEAAFYGFGAAIQNINESELERRMEKGDIKAARLLRIVNRPTRFVNTIQVASHAIVMIMGVWFLRQWSIPLEKLPGQVPAAYEGLLRGGVMTALGILMILVLVCFGIIVPKYCAAKKPEVWGYRLLPLMKVIMAVLSPLTLAAYGISYVVLRMLGINIRAKEENVTEEDILSMVNEGHEQGVLEANEAELIANIFELDDKKAADIMTHRINLAAIDGKMPLKEAIDYILTEGINSRYPVYGEDLDDIIGILHMKDAMIYGRDTDGNLPIKDIPGLLRQAHFIPETRSIDRLFREMQTQNIHMEIVVDEYGQTAGIVTMEDILEEIVGNIQDEYDTEEEFISASEDGFVLDGLTPLEDAATALGITFSHEDEESFDTLNGFLISKLSHIPQEGEEASVEYGGYCFTIQQVENKIIQRVKATLLHVDDDGKSDGYTVKL